MRDGPIRSIEELRHQVGLKYTDSRPIYSNTNVNQVDLEKPEMDQMLSMNVVESILTS